MEVQAIAQLMAIISGAFVVIWHKQHTTNKFRAEIREAFDRFRVDVDSFRAEVASPGQTKWGAGGGGR